MRTRIFSSCLVATIATAIDLQVINEMTQNYAQIQVKQTGNGLTHTDAEKPKPKCCILYSDPNRAGDMSEPVCHDKEEKSKEWPVATLLLGKGVQPGSIRCGEETWASLTRAGEDWTRFSSAGSVDLNI